MESYERDCAEKLRVAEEAHTFGLQEKERLKTALTVVQPFVEKRIALRMGENIRQNLHNKEKEDVGAA